MEGIRLKRTRFALGENLVRSCRTSGSDGSTASAPKIPFTGVCACTALASRRERPFRRPPRFSGWTQPACLRMVEMVLLRVRKAAQPTRAPNSMNSVGRVGEIRAIRSRKAKHIERQFAEFPGRKRAFAGSRANHLRAPVRWRVLRCLANRGGRTCLLRQARAAKIASRFSLGGACLAKCNRMGVDRVRGQAFPQRGSETSCARCGARNVRHGIS